MRLIKADDPDTIHNKQQLYANIQILTNEISKIIEEFKNSGAENLISDLKTLVQKPIKAKQWQIAKNNVDVIVTLLDINSSTSKLSGYFIKIEWLLSFIIELENRIKNPMSAKYDDELLDYDDLNKH